MFLKLYTSPLFKKVRFKTKLGSNHVDVYLLFNTITNIQMLKTIREF